MTKIKQRIVAILLVIVLVISLTVTLNIVFVPANSEYMQTPQITVLTHGLADFNGA